MRFQRHLCGDNMDQISDFHFKFMSFMFSIRDVFSTPENKLYKFGIKPGDTLIDYGCGPGTYIKKASELIGSAGTIYGVDLHKMAIDAVNKRVKKYNLQNVKTSLVSDYKCPIESDIADVIYALDMFHMVKEPYRFLKELHRMIKKEGRLFIEDGHQPRKKALKKIKDSCLWDFIEEKKEWLICSPV